MTPEQLKKKLFEQVIKIDQEKLDTEEGESTKDEENPPHLQRSQKKLYI